MARLFVVLLAAFCMLKGGPVEAQGPKTVRLMVGFAAGGPLDNWTRIVAGPLSEKLGVPVVVENRPGAEGAIAADAVRRAVPDGSTLLVSGPSTLATAGMGNGGLALDAVREFAPVSLMARFTMALFVHPSTARSVDELLRQARANPNGIFYATSAAIDTILATQILRSSQTTMTRLQYKGAVQVIPDLLGGRVQVAITPLTAGLAHARDDKLRLLAVFAPRRVSLAPEAPTIAEAGLPDVSSPTWVALFGPAGMPKHVVVLQNRALKDVLGMADVRDKYARQAVVPEGSTPEELAELLQRDIKFWRDTMAGVQASNR